MSRSVGLVVPVYGNLPYLPTMLDSVAAQTTAFDEVVLVDDASPDPAVRTLLREWTSTQPFARLIELERNSGIGVAQQTGVDALSTEFVAFLDCDDWLDPTAVGEVKSVLAAETDYVFTRRWNVSESDTYVYRPESVWARFSSFEACLLEHMVASHLKTVSRRALDACGPFRREWDGVQDWIVAVRTIRDDNWVYVPKPVYYHRIHANQTTNSNRKGLLNIVNGTRVAVLEERGVGRRTRRVETIRQLAYAASLLRNTNRQTNIILASVGGRTVEVASLSGLLRDSALHDCDAVLVSAREWMEISETATALRASGVEVALEVSGDSSASIEMGWWYAGFLDHIVPSDPTGWAALTSLDLRDRLVK